MIQYPRFTSSTLLFNICRLVGKHARSGKLFVDISCQNIHPSFTAISFSAAPAPTASAKIPGMLTERLLGRFNHRQATGSQAFIQLRNAIWSSINRLFRRFPLQQTCYLMQCINLKMLGKEKLSLCRKNRKLKPSLLKVCQKCNFHINTQTWTNIMVGMD